MNIINPQSINFSNPVKSTNSPSRVIENEQDEKTQASKYAQDSTASEANRQQNQNLFRIDRVANQIESYDAQSKLNSKTSERSSNNQPPISQYQNNQQLLQREALGGLIGVDLFA